MGYLHHVYDYDVIVAGGGLAGLTAAIHLSNNNFNVLVVEKQAYPRHKVCGEYVSNEVKDYLYQFGIPIHDHTPIAIDTLQLSTHSGKSITVKLPLGGFGLSRYAFDNILYKNALNRKVDFEFDTIVSIVNENGFFSIHTKKGRIFTSKLALGTFGKRSNLDIELKRKFIKKKSPWLGVKMHYEYADHPRHIVGLHNFEGGYGGISKVEDGSVNFCYLVSYESFRRVASVEDFTESIVRKNPILDAFLAKSVPKFEKPLTIAQISFEKKEPVIENIPMLGDSAGMIHPLCGNGMAMAIHSAKIASECAVLFLHDKSTLQQMNDDYRRIWNKKFHKRLWMGRQIQHLLLNPRLSQIALHSIARSEHVLKGLIAQTHGEPILN